MTYLYKIWYYILVICLIFLHTTVSSQSLDNYTVTRLTANPFTSISSTGNSFASWYNTTNLDNNRSVSTPIGFDYWFNGIRYTSFNVSTNGFIDFTNNTEDGNGPAYGPDNTKFAGNGLGSQTILALAPFYDNLNASSSLGANVKYQLSGTTPNRVLTVEWNNLNLPTDPSVSLTFQLKLYETTGTIEFVYGTMTAGSGSFSYTSGINTSTEFRSQQTENSTTFSIPASNNLSTLPASNSLIRFTSPVPSPSLGTLSFTFVSSTSMSLNWPDWATNEAGYIIYKSTDGINYFFETQTAINATSQSVLNLSPSTTYYWKVFAVTEGALSSTSLTGAQSTSVAGNFISKVSGNWHDPNVWLNGGALPGPGDNVIIDNGHTVTIASNISCNNLTVGQGTSGTLIIGNNNTDRTLTIGGNILVNPGGTFRPSGNKRFHTITIKGNIENNGTLNLNVLNAGRATTYFTKNDGNQTISGTGSTTNFYIIHVNMGTSSLNTLEVTSTSFSAPNSFLTLTSGIFKFSSPSALTITPFNSSETIAAGCGLIMNSPLSTLYTINGIITNKGLVQLDAGTINLGSLLNNNLTSEGGRVVISGGTFNIAGRFDRTSSTAITDFTMSGGTLLVNKTGSDNTLLSPFTIDASGSSFTMSGGTIIIQREGGTGAQNLGYVNTASTYSVTGGTIQIGNASTPAAQIMNINSLVPVYNLVVTNANTQASLVNNLNVLGNITIASGNLNANNLAISLAGNWTNNALFTQGTGLVTVNGSIPQSIGGTSITTFNDLTINNASGILSGNDVNVAGVLNFSSGVITTGTYKVSITGTGSVTGAGTAKFVNGFLEKQLAIGTNVLMNYEIGSGSTNYLPLALAFSSVSTAGQIKAWVSSSDHSDIQNSCIDELKSVNRYWQLTNTGSIFTNYSATCNFVTSDQDAGSIPADYIMAINNGGTWSTLTTGTATTSSNQATGILSMGDLQVGERRKPVITIQPANTMGCQNSAIAFSITATGLGLTYQWQENQGSGFVNIIDGGIYSGATTSALAISSASALMNGYQYQCIVSSLCLSSTVSLPAILTVSLNGSWIGVVSSDWNNASNWCGGIPTGISDITIPSATPFSPVLTNTSNCKNITINSGATVDLSGKELIINSACSGIGVIKGSPLSKLTFNGNGSCSFYMDQSVNGITNSLHTLSINSPGATITNAGNLQITNTLNVVSGTFNTGNALTLISNASGTARIASLAAAADITGNVTVQRYLPSGSGWRLIGAPVSGGTLQQWDDDFITGGFPGSAYPTVTGASIITYDETLPGLYDDGYVEAGNITDPLTVKKGYWAYIMNAPLTMDATGPVIKHSQTFPVTYTSTGVASEDGWNLIANPYASTIDWDAAGWTKTNINDAIYVYNPAFDQYSAYVGGIGILGGSQYIASSQGFLVQTNGNSPALILNESVKDATDGSFIRSSQSTSIDQLRLKITGNGSTDETVVVFRQGATNSFESNLDALKVYSENPDKAGIATVNSVDNEFAINSLATVTDSLSIPVKVKVGITGNYVLTIDSSSSLPLGTCLQLEDLHTGALVPVSTGQSFNYSISDTTTQYRFIIHIKAPFSVQALVNEPALCDTVNTGSITIASASNATISIINSGGGSVSTLTNFSGSQTFNNLSPGTYLITSSNSCYTRTDTITIHSSAAVTANFTSSEDTVSFYNKSAIEFTETSTGCTWFEWNFGDGSPTMTGNTVNYLFNSPGTYTVTLTAGNSSCSTTSTQTIVIEDDMVTGLDHSDALQNSLDVFIRDGKAYLKIRFLQEQTNIVHVYDMLGRELIPAEEIDGNGDFTLSLPDISTGYYIFKVESGSGVINRAVRF